MMLCGIIAKGNFLMKINENNAGNKKKLPRDLIIKRIDLHLIYKEHIERIEGENGSHHIVVYWEEIHTDKVPIDGNRYFVPSELINHKEEKKIVLARCTPSLRCIQPPYYIPDSNGKLINIDETGFIDYEKGYSGTALIDEEETAGDSTHMPDFVAYDDFLPADIPSDICFEFNIVSLEPMDADFENKFSGNNEDYDPEGVSYFLPEYTLHKVQLKQLPTTGLRWYLPVEIKFNKQQTRKGYALYDVKNQSILDVHIFDQRYGLVSVTFQYERLEDCGIFKDDKVFSYELLLSEI